MNKQKVNVGNVKHEQTTEWNALGEHRHPTRANGPFIICKSAIDNMDVSGYIRKRIRNMPDVF